MAGCIALSHACDSSVMTKVTLSNIRPECAKHQ